MPQRIVLDENNLPYLTDEEVSYADNLRTLGIDTNESTFDLSKIELTRHHDLIQEGPYVRCTDTMHSHSSQSGIYIGTGKNLVRLADGSYTIRNA